MLENLILSLHDIGALQFGSFTLKSGMQSPIYIDLRRIVSCPELLNTVAQEMWSKVCRKKIDLVCGVPYTAMPMATAMSLAHRIPMVMRRKEAKNYGTKKIIEGIFAAGQHCLVVEDLVTSGASVFETIGPLEEEGLKVTDIVILIDREQGGRQLIEDKGYNLHAVMTITQLLNVLHKHGRIDSQKKQETLEFISNAQVSAIP